MLIADHADATEALPAKLFGKCRAFRLGWLCFAQLWTENRCPLFLELR